MVFRFPSAFLFAALCLLSLHNANAFRAADWRKMKLKLRSFSWLDCGNSTYPAHVQSLTVSPDPLVFPGDITFNTSFSLSTASPADFSLKLTLEKKVAGFFIKVPCIDNIGSCTYGGICGAWGQVCPQYFQKYGLPCNCPIPPNTYSVPDITFPVSQSIPGIASGEYRLTGSLFASTGDDIVCLQAIVDLSS